MSNTKKIERPHIVWAIFPPLYWILWAGIGLLVGVIISGQEAITGVVAVYAMGLGCAVGAIFAGPAFDRVCGHFEMRGCCSATSRRVVMKTNNFGRDKVRKNGTEKTHAPASNNH